MHHSDRRPGGDRPGNTELQQAVEKYRDNVWRELRSLPRTAWAGMATQLEKVMAEDEASGLSDLGREPALQMNDGMRYAWQLRKNYLETIPLSEPGRELHVETRTLLDLLKTTGRDSASAAQSYRVILRHGENFLYAQDMIDRASTLVKKGQIALASEELPIAREQLNIQPESWKISLERAEAEHDVMTRARTAYNLLFTSNGVLPCIQRRVQDRAYDVQRQLNDAIFQLTANRR